MTEKMKPSGIAWMGDIPTEWDLTKVRFVTKVRSEKGYYGAEDKYIGLENISSYTGKYIPAETEYDPGLYDIYREGDVLFSKLRPYLAKALIATDDGFCTGELEIISDYLGDKRFLFYYLLSDGFLKMVDASTYGTKMPRANWDYIKNLQIPVVPYWEQRTIADFLDAQCAKIDSVIADIEKQVETLQKYKRSLITEAVTKGLDRSAPIQHSGIDWIGTIPAHWNIKRIKYVASKIGSGKTPKGGAEVYEDEGITFIRSQNVYDDGLHLEDVKYISESIDAEMHTTRLLFGDVLFNITGASIGRCCIYSLQDKGNVNQHVCIIRTNEKCYNEYLRYVLNSDIGKVQTAINQMGGNRDSLTFEQIGLFVFPLPPRHEQVEIANVLRDKCKHVEAVINEKKKELATIHQYKQSLTYEYVTGKKRVTEVN